MLVVGLAFVAYLLWWPPRHLMQLFSRVPELRATLIGFGVLALLGYGLNDAGVVVPGLMLGVLVCTLVPLVLVPVGGAGREPAEGVQGVLERPAPLEQPDRADARAVDGGGLGAEQPSRSP